MKNIETKIITCTHFNCNIDAEPASLVYLQIQVWLEESHIKLYSEIPFEALLLLISIFFQKSLSYLIYKWGNSASSFDG